MEVLALGIAGIVAPLLTELIKKLTGWKKYLALSLAFVVSVVVAIVAILITKPAEFGLADVAGKSLIVFGLATIVYKGIVEPIRGEEKI